VANGSIHVAVIGAGALGRVYGVHLETAGARVTFVVRRERVGDAGHFVVERLNGDRTLRESLAPQRTSEIPRSADAILLAVRGEQIDSALIGELRSGPDVPVIALTPLLPRGQERLAAALGTRLVVAMPTLAAKLDADGVVRYWAFGRSPTLIEKSDRWRVVLARLAGRFAASHLGVRLERGVSQRNPATTIAFFPLSVAIGGAGGVSALCERDELLRMAGDACRESLELARRIGPIEPAAVVGSWLSRPRTLRAGLALGQRFLPRAVEFVDAHFGSKLDAQHAAFGAEILELARDSGLEMPSLARLLASAARNGRRSAGAGSSRGEQLGETDRGEHEHEHSSGD
jgi:hypothetical protein